MNRRILLAITAGALIVFIFLFHYYSHLGQENMKAIITKTEAVIEKELNQLELKLNRDFLKAEKMADSLAIMLHSNISNMKKIIPKMAYEVEENGYSALGIHLSREFTNKIKFNYRADYYLRKNGKKLLYSPFYKNSTNKLITFPYDYTDDKTNGRFWYTELIQKGNWAKPYFGPANRNFVISYRSPIGWSETKKRNNGIVCVDYSLNYLRDKVGTLNLLESGYGIIVSDDGMIISHPVDDYLGMDYNALEKKIEFEKLDELDENKFHDIQDLIPLLKDKLMYRKPLRIKTASGKLLSYRSYIFLNKNETMMEYGGGPGVLEKDQGNLRILLVLLATIILLLSVYYFFKRYFNQKHWLFVGLFSFITVFAICTIWYFHLLSPNFSTVNREIEISDKTEMQAFFNSYHRKNEVVNQNQKDLYIKTGFFIESVRFLSANDILVTGYHWQKSGRENSGIVFPEAEEFSSEITYSDKNLTRYRFKALLRQAFDYSQYPFDDETVWIRVRPKSFTKNQLFLQPDFDSYPSFKKEASGNGLTLGIKNGLEKDLFIEGWNIKRTYFSYRKNTYTSNFGDKNIAGEIKIPELYFNISVRRNFMEVFVVYMIPIIVTAFLLFAVLMINTRNKEKNELFGFNSATVLAFCASLFFVLIVSHMSLRDALQAKGIIYLEYFFFCLYAALAMVSVYSIRFVQKNSDTYLNKDDGQIIKLAFWPIFLIAVLFITSLRFINF